MLLICSVALKWSLYHRLKTVVFSCHIMSCHTSFPLCAYSIRVAVLPQLLPTGVVCDSWCAAVLVEHVPFLEVVLFLKRR